MAIEIQRSTDNKKLTIIVTGRFDFSLHNEFRNTYRQINEPGIYVRLDLGGTEYLDSSALGMLLLKEHVEASKGRVCITNPKPNIKDVLTLANFDKLFSFEG